MKRIIYITLAFIFASTAVCSAQMGNLRTAYFLDGYTYNYKLNPAFAPERGFLAIPLLGNPGVAVESNLGLSTFLYPTSNGGLTTFLDDSVSDRQFLDGLNKNNLIGTNFNFDIFALGFRTGKMFHTIDVSLKGDVGLNLPKDLFSFVKTGTADGSSSWDISNMGAKAKAYVEGAYGLSRSFGKNLRVGLRFKFLMGYMNANVNIDKLSLTMSEQQWTVNAKGAANIAGPIKIGTEEGSNLIDFSNIQIPEDDEALLAPLTTEKNIGMAFDLGASYDFLKYFTASVAVLDLGTITWKNPTLATTPDSAWKFDGFGTITTDSENSIGDQFAQMGEDFADMIKLEKIASSDKMKDKLAATFHAGLEFRMPFYQRLTLGLLGTHRMNGQYSWSEGRLALNYAPLKFFSLAGSVAMSDFGTSYGAVANIHLPGLNIYAGLDSFKPLLNMTPQFIPIDQLNTNVVFGANISFGKAVGRYRTPKEKKSKKVNDVSDSQSPIES